MDPQMVVRILANIDGLREALAQGGSAIQNTTAGMQKMAASFSGDRLVQQAVNMAAAIDKVGGVTTLTAAEMARANAVFERAAEKLTALGNTGAAAQMNAYAEATRNTVPPVNSLKDSVSQLTTKIGSEFNTQFKATLAGFVSGQAIINAISGAWRTFTGFVSSSVSSFLAAEKAQVQLTAALRASGNATPATIKQFNDLAATFQRTTVFSDDLITEMQGLLTQVGGVLPQQMEGALKAATNLASGLGIDLRQATMLVGKAFEGETSTLKRYGIVIDEAKLKAEGLPAVLEAINSKFGGQAAAAMDTTAGKLVQLANEWDNVKEAIGGAIITDPLVQAFLSAITESARKSAEGLAAQSKALTDVEKEAQRAADATAKFNLQNDDLFTQLVLKGVPGLLAARREVDNLRDSYQQAAEEAAALNKAIAAIPSVPKNINTVPGPLAIPPGTLDGFIKVKKAADDATKSAEAYAKTIQSIRDKLTGGGAIKAADDYAKAVMEQGRVIPLTVKGMEQLVAVLDEALQSTKPLPPEVQKLVLELMKLGVLEPPLTRGIENLWGEIQKLGQVAQDTNAWARMLAEDGIKTLNTNTKEGGRAFAEMLKGLVDLGMELPPTEKKTEDLADAFGAASQMIGQFAGQSTEAMLATTAFSMAASISTGTVQGYASALMVGISAIGNYIEAQAAEERARVARHAAARAQGQDIRRTLLDTYGTMQQIDALGRLLGVDLAAMLEPLTRPGRQRFFDPEALAELNEQFAKELEKLFKAVEGNAGLASDQLLRVIGQLEQAQETAEIANDFIRANLSDAAAGLNALLGGLSDSSVARQRANLTKTFEAEKEAINQTLAEYQREYEALDGVEGAHADNLRKRLQRIIEDERAMLVEKQSAYEEALKNIQGEFIQTETQARGLAGAVVGTFGEMIARGVSFRDALEAVQPSIDTLRAELARTGFDGGVAFRMLDEMSRIAGDSIMGPLVDAIGGARSALTGLHNSQLLNQESFAAIASSATQAYEAIIAQGGDGAAALAMMQPTLQTIWKLQQDFGYEVDESTQKLIDQAVAAGLVGKAQLTDSQKQVVALEDIGKKMGELLGFFQRLLPASDEAGKEVADAMKTGGIAVADVSKKALDAAKSITDVKTSAMVLQMTFDDSDYGEVFRNARKDVEDLIDAINSIPGWSGSGSSGMADYAYRTASSDTLGPSVAYRTAPMTASDSRAVDELRAIRRQLADQQPDIVIVPMVTGDADAFESRMAEAMPRRVTRSANLRNAWQRAVNGSVGG